MTIAANKRSTMTLFTGSDLYSHQVRIALAEKDGAADVEAVDLTNPPEDFLELNPYHTLPTLVDRELVLYRSNIILEYLDERFPHPPLLPVYPVARAEKRLMMYRIDNDWYSLAQQIQTGSEVVAEQARQQLREELLAIAPIFAEMPFFMSDEFSLLDCALAPLLWRLPMLDIQLTGIGAKEVISYANRIFERESFLISLLNEERDQRKTALIALLERARK